MHITIIAGRAAGGHAYGLNHNEPADTEAHQSRAGVQQYTTIR
jgi:hypothetical protein